MAIAADNTQGINDFRKELINRFFNPKSYFLFSFITDLKNQEALLENPENVAVVGLVVDEILNARDKIETLFELTKISGFDEFYHLLMEKVGFLRMSHLTTQQMMETVKNLGILLSETFSEMMTHPDSKKQLLQYVGLEVEHPALEEEPIPDVSEEESRAEKPPDQELQTDLSSEAVTHSSNLDDLFRDVQKPSQIVDPWDFFHDDVAQKLDEINALLPEFKANKHNRALLQKIKLAFQELREWSMIQGNEGIETIAMRTLTVLNFILRTSRFPMEKIIPDIEEAVKALQEVNHSGWAGENLDIVPIVVHSLETLSKTVQTIAGENQAPEIPEEEASGAEAEAEVEAEAEAAVEPVKQEDAGPKLDEEFEAAGEDFSISEMEKLYDEMFPEDEPAAAPEPEEKLSAAQPEVPSEEKQDDPEQVALEEDSSGEIPEEALPLSKIDEDTSPGEKDPEDAEEISIPGENDEELLQVIGELSEENNGPPPENEKSGEVDEKSEAGNSPAGYSELIQRGGKDFVEEAEMYFQFARRAFSSLEQNQNARRAYEDIELACYSLKILARKLGYGYTARIVDKIESIFKEVIAGELLLQKENISYASDVLLKIEEFGNENRLSDDKLGTWASKVLTALANFKETHVKPENYENETARQGGTESFKDPLEFLMYDDAGKYFKQLLDE